MLKPRCAVIPAQAGIQLIGGPSRSESNPLHVLLRKAFVLPDGRSSKLAFGLFSGLRRNDGMIFLMARY
ncbi:MAG: hypothetical protein COV51_05325 [Gallionellaceae bacterium CG11_big_fil_rev_8_21_14_0_20_60_62]|nr:MAG: hypothetical protein COV51_05325 [Gallionellaceae bacterium CG11_big_fil_rev_8_21_14_0_20_60_62]